MRKSWTKFSKGSLCEKAPLCGTSSASITPGHSSKAPWPSRSALSSMESCLTVSKSVMRLSCLKNTSITTANRTLMISMLSWKASCLLTDGSSQSFMQSELSLCYKMCTNPSSWSASSRGFKRTKCLILSGQLHGPSSSEWWSQSVRLSNIQSGSTFASRWLSVGIVRTLPWRRCYSQRT